MFSIVVYIKIQKLSVCCVCFFVFWSLPTFLIHVLVGNSPFLAPLKPINGSLAAAKGDVSVDVIFVEKVKKSRQIRN